MIRLSNGHEFKYATSSGALGYRGDGWPPVETVCRWLGLLRPEAFTHITKTLTYWPLKGRFSWLRPWRSVRYAPGGDMVNAVALTNPGLVRWSREHYPVAMARGRKIIVSVAPNNRHEARAMAYLLRDTCPGVVGIELNPFCPNKSGTFSAMEIRDLVRDLRDGSCLDVGIKLGWQDQYLEIIDATQRDIAFVDLINACPWDLVYPGRRSPLEVYGYKGSVSGRAIKEKAREALREVGHFNVQKMSGGGIDSADEVRLRFSMNADAVAFGTIFSRRYFTDCVLPNRIIREVEGSTTK